MWISRPWNHRRTWSFFFLFLGGWPWSRVKKHEATHLDYYQTSYIAVTSLAFLTNIIPWNFCTKNHDDLVLGSLARWLVGSLVFLGWEPSRFKSRDSQRYSLENAQLHRYTYSTYMLFICYRSQWLYNIDSWTNRHLFLVFLKALVGKKTTEPAGKPELCLFNNLSWSMTLDLGLSLIQGECLPYLVGACSNRMWPAT